VPFNPERVVVGLLEYFRLHPEEVIDFRGEKICARKVFSSIETTRVSSQLFERLKDVAVQSKDRQALCDLSPGGDMLWFLQTYVPGGVCFADIADVIQPMTPRLYSVASSSCVHPHRIELTVTRVWHEFSNHRWWGACSNFLTHELSVHQPVRFFIQPSPHFTFPITQQPFIMVAAGAGIAPFRALLQEVDAGIRQLPPSWLFFGGRNRSSDYFYEEFLERQCARGLRIDTAFSRDQEHKIYVQHKMWEHKKELWQWIEDRAIIFVCGSARKMAKDVDRCLADIATEVGKIPDAFHWLRTLHHEGRYLRDVY
jgi:sulfite reductase (NADPH) flavoprotein alpha-component